MSINTNTNMKKNALCAGTGALTIVLFIFTTNPQILSVPLLLTLPVLVGITAFYVNKLILGLFTQANAVRTRELSIILALVPTLMVIFGSLDQLGLQDIILSLLLVGGFGWYVKRFRTSVRQSL